MFGKKSQEPKKQSLHNSKSYVCTFGAGYVAGITGELVAALQSGKFNANGLTHPSVRDNCIISGTQQIAKEFSKNCLKSNEKFMMMTKGKPFLFGAATGIPMWALTRVVATPLQNRHDRKKGPFTGFARSVVNEAAYYTIKNGLDEYCGAKILPELLPKVDCFATKKLVESSVSGLVAGGSYLLACPVKSMLTGSSFLDAYNQFVKAVPKAAVKKATYSLTRPKLVALLK